jgi:calcineurin-like phosphoesterase family protein
LHISHKNIANFRKEVTSEAHNREVIKYFWDKQVTKRDLVWVLGDAAFDEEGIDWIGTLAGEKRLVRGNHDMCPTSSYLRTFSEVYGLVRYKGMWLSHAPVHPDELRGRPSVHGHTHYHNISMEHCEHVDDPRYLNCSVENLMRNYGSPLISLAQVREYFK